MTFVVDVVGFVVDDGELVKEVVVEGAGRPSGVRGVAKRKGRT